MKLLLTLMITGFVCMVVRADDWTTTDGVVFRNVKVVKLEDNCVTILDSHGGARVQLAKLPPDVQKKLGYNPVAAKAAADKRASDDKANAVALQKEMDAAAAILEPSISYTS